MKKGARGLSRFSKREVDTVFNTVLSRFASHGIVLLRAPRLYTYGRILVIVPKKVGDAPARNRIKRQLKSLFYQQRLFEHSFDTIALIRINALTLTFKELTALVLKAFAQRVENNEQKNKAVISSPESSSCPCTP